MTEDKKTEAPVNINIHVAPPVISVPSMGVQPGPGQAHLRDEKRPAENDQPVVDGPAKAK